MKKGHLALSGILLQQQKDAAAGANGLPLGASQSAALDPKGNEAVRIFKPGEQIAWGFQILNARKHKDQQQPNVAVETRLFQDGKEIYHNDPVPIGWPADTASDQLAASGGMRLGEKFAPGDYTLQVVVTDNEAKKKYAMASQWIDFDVVSP